MTFCLGKVEMVMNDIVMEVNRSVSSRNGVVEVNRKVLFWRGRVL